jgi:3-methyladenine DNA glycosylase AlkD
LPTAKTKPAAGRGRTAAKASKDEVATALHWLERHGTKRNRDGLARYGIEAPKAFGVPMGKIHLLAKRLGRNHELALALWETGWYEARLLTAFVAEPERLTPGQMDRWCRDFDNWAVCDTLCFHLFDRTPHAFGKVAQWSRRRPEFVRRAAFALLASVALHDKRSSDEPFERCLPLIEAAARDERNSEGRELGPARHRRAQPPLRTAATTVARRLILLKPPRAGSARTLAELLSAVDLPDESWPPPSPLICVPDPVFGALVHALQGVFEFSSDPVRPSCSSGATRSTADARQPLLPSGSPVLELHLWNERSSVAAHRSRHRLATQAAHRLRRSPRQLAYVISADRRPPQLVRRRSWLADRGPNGARRLASGTTRTSRYSSLIGVGRFTRWN